MPSEAKEKDREGASSFANHYLEVINYSVATTTTDQLKELTSRQCELCAQRLIDPIDAANLNGAWQVGGQYEYELIDLIESSSNRAVAVFNTSVEEQKVYSEPHKLVREWRGAKDRVLSLEIHFDKSWKVTKLATPEK